MLSIKRVGFAEKWPRFGARALYHLEHHLYPAVPHHHWPALARRLDPYFDAAGIVPVKFGF